MESDIHEPDRIFQMLNDTNRHPLPWAKSGSSRSARMETATKLCAKVLGPLANVFCYFACDMGGLRGVALRLAVWLSMPATSDAPGATLPRVVVIVESSSANYKSAGAKKRLLTMLSEELVNILGRVEHQLVQQHIDRHINDISIYPMTKAAASPDGSAGESCETVASHLRAVAAEVQVLREAASFSFKCKHFVSFLAAACGHISTPSNKPFEFASATRGTYEVSATMSAHIAEWISLQPSSLAVSSLAVPVLASALLMDCRPPGMHSESHIPPADTSSNWIADFEASYVFRAIYHDACTAAAKIIIRDTPEATYGDRGRFLGLLQNEFTTIYKSLTARKLSSHHFDFVVGSSAGGLIAISLFLKHWTIEDSQSKFISFATEVFKPHHIFNVPILSRLVQLMVSFFKDSVYRTASIETVFQTTFGSGVPMFNPLNSDTKVAVTTTTVQDIKPCILTNYNGSFEGKQKYGYTLLRAKSASQDASLLDAIAISESRRLWGPKKIPDLILSLGTGTVEQREAKSDDHLAAAKDRTLTRLFNSFMTSLDGEKTWVDLYGSVPDQGKPKYHRLNISLADSPPDLDDVDGIKNLMSTVKQDPALDSKLLHVTSRFFASLFYLELRQLPVYQLGLFRCVGDLHCRVEDGSHSLTQVWSQLRDRETQFLFNGRVLLQINGEADDPSQFLIPVQLHVQSLTQYIDLQIHGTASAAESISGFPQTIQNIADLQELDSPFGRYDHGLREVVEKPLPELPKARKRKGDHLEKP
ncbi:MAG: hypothetical protein M1814_000917 [Vezdaea aestivalis]|nr:MAG: hypothetical protein M1814_000917 [Vezdaea aestivalis]